MVKVAVVVLAVTLVVYVRLIFRVLSEPPHR